MSPSRLRLEDLVVEDLLSIAKHSPATSALRRSQDPDAWVTPELVFLREIDFSTRILRWHNTQDGHDGIRPPKWVPLTEAERRAVEPERLDPLPIPDMLAWLGWAKPNPN